MALLIEVQNENAKLRQALESCIRDGLQLLGIGIHGEGMEKDDSRVSEAYNAIPADESTIFGTYKMLL